MQAAHELDINIPNNAFSGSKLHTKSNNQEYINIMITDVSGKLAEVSVLGSLITSTVATFYI